MKRFIYTTLCILLTSVTASAQGEMDALRMARGELSGTARSISMGGAFGALGGDVGGININPAGLGIYKSSEIITTVNFRNNQTKTNLNAGDISKSKFQFSFDNFAMVGAFPTNDDVIPFINFSFAYNKLKNYDRKYNSIGQNQTSSLTDYIRERANYGNPDAITGSFPYEGGDWLGALGFNSGLLSVDDDKWFHNPLNDGETVNSDLYVREKGEVDSYDFSIGTTFSDMISAGLSVAVTNLDYKLYSSHMEDYRGGGGGGMELVNEMKTEGTGWQVKAGVIFKPVEEFRLGVAYHSPTWYNMTDYYVADMFLNGVYKESTPYGQTDYDFRTPDKWVFSAAGVIGQRAIISVDYELTNYKSNTRYSNVPRRSEMEYANSYIEDDFRNASTIRVGAEVRFTPQFSGRVGYSWMQSPLNNNIKDNDLGVITSGTVPHYVLEGDANYFTWGLGYRFTPHFYTDIAFVIKTQKDDLYNFAKFYEPDVSPRNLLVDNYRASLKNNVFNGLITFGYKF
ncbi:MAG: OmpP1/FadL family transporter [Dysgonomonas sp.]